MRPRPLLTITGTGFPKIQPGSGPIDKSVPANVDTKSKACYELPVFQLCEDDLARAQNLRGLPLCDEHLHLRNGNPRGKCKDCVGEVVEARVLKDHSVYVVASVDATPNGERAVERLRNGKRCGFSMGYLNLRDSDTGPVTGRSIREISLTDAPHWPVCSISVTASAGEKDKKDGPVSTVEEVWIPIDMSTTSSSSSSMQAPAADAAVAPATGQGEASAAQPSLVQEAAAIAKDSAALQLNGAELKAQLERLAEYDRKAAEAEAAAAEANRAKAKGWTPSLRNHLGELVTEEVANSWVELSTSKNPAVLQQVKVQEAIVAKLDAQEKAVKEKEDVIAKLQEALKQRENEHKILETHVREARSNLRNPAAAPFIDNVPKQEASAVPVTANSGGSSSKNLVNQLTDYFVIPVAHSKWEQRLINDTHPNAELRDFASPNVPVTANSETVAPNGFIQVPPLPTHKFVHRVQGGPRGVKDSNGFPTGAAMLSKLVHDMDYAFGLPVSEKTRVNTQQGYTYKMEDGRTHTIGTSVESEVRVRL